MTMAGPRANIVHSPDFESGAIPAAQDAEEDENESFVERFRKKRSLMQQEQHYELLRSIPPTSNIVERVFSVTRTTFGHERNSLQPITLEQILFLRQNESYWDVSTVGSLRS
ncbi:hypothetical protein JG687_00019248 [Phytophthora cactorum]|uniref:HAT C-terminal dimerisation domain-containing protein n=1 Tax=Phytophthora cactorum TaxID=29920 RepID=A0A8T1TJA4_9STRA|nr:hypothetical protein JG687_00019248 [Phytophthora cactorum]